MQQPLEGVTVLDASQVMAGPFCTHLLRLLGARVIKVEKPGEGDALRHYSRDSKFARRAPPFIGLNVGKESVSLNLKHAQGVEAVRRLAARADVLVETFRPGVMARLGLGYEDLKPLNERLIYCSVTGYGQSGPMRDQPAYDHVVQAVCGLMTVSGEPGSGPTKVGFPLVDTFTGYCAAFGILAALQQRARTGLGQLVDVAMLDSALVLMISVVAPYLTTGVEPRKTGNRGYNRSPTSDTFASKDRSITLGANTQQQFTVLCRVIGRSDLPDDPRFATTASREDHADELGAEIQAALLARTAAEWEALLNAAGVPAGMVRTVPEVLSEPHLRARELILSATGAGEDHFSLDIGARLEHRERAPMSAPPAAGEHTRSVLQELGYSERELEALASSGVI
ncbi:MAG: CoA transferase [Burkholderiales bacterium]|nr:CoA transferase [Burkholderiales bacterium]